MSVYQRFLANEKIRRLTVLLSVIFVLFLVRSMITTILLTFIFTYLMIHLVQIIQRFVRIPTGIHKVYPDAYSSNIRYDSICY